MVLNMHGMDFMLAIIFYLLRESNYAVFKQMMQLSKCHTILVTANLVVTFLA